MNSKLKGIFLLACAVCVVVLALSFFSGSQPLEVSSSVFTEQMVNDLQAQKVAVQQKRQNVQAARERAETENKIYSCTSDEQCIIVDKDPCGCLIGTSGVTAINADWSLEFSKLLEKDFASAASCPSQGSAERECSASAQAVCRENHCTIVW